MGNHSQLSSLDSPGSFSSIKKNWTALITPLSSSSSLKSNTKGSSEVCETRKEVCETLLMLYLLAFAVDKAVALASSFAAVDSQLPVELSSNLLPRGPACHTCNILCLRHLCRKIASHLLLCPSLLFQLSSPFLPASPLPLPPLLSFPLPFDFPSAVFPLSFFPLSCARSISVGAKPLSSEVSVIVGTISMLPCRTRGLSLSK